MRFTLIYDGPLESAGNKPKKEQQWAIRKQLHPQLKKLWEETPDLAELLEDSRVPLDGQQIVMRPHHEAEGLRNTTLSPNSGFSYIASLIGPMEPTIDLCAPVKRAGRAFLPLVRTSLALTCGLTIQFLRQEPKGSVYQGGDLDGRIKLLLDSLSVPQADNQVCEDSDCPDPLYCLTENDSLFTSLAVESEKLLYAAPQPDPHFVRLVIAVDVRVTRARGYNEAFRSD